jgi:hypothetical protein
MGSMKGRIMNRHAEAVSTLTLLSLLITGCCQPGVPCQNGGGSFGPSEGEVIGVGVAVVAAGGLTVAAVVVSDKHRHNLKGCASQGPNGLQLENNSDKMTYSLAGVTADVKAGHIVRVHGKKEKKHKDNPGNQEFLVEKVTKDYGPCKNLTASSATTQATTTVN